MRLLRTKSPILFTFLIAICCFPSFSQEPAVKKMLNEIEGQWEVDDYGNVTYQRIIEVPTLSREEIYSRALSFFTYNYVSGEDVIQIQDKAAGQIIGKGIYKDVHVLYSIVTSQIDTWHILRIDIKDGRARVLLTLSEYRETNTNYPTVSYTISKTFPIKTIGATYKNYFGKAFYKSHHKALDTLAAIEKAIREGSISKSIESKDW